MVSNNETIFRILKDTWKSMNFPVYLSHDNFNRILLLLRQILSIVIVISGCFLQVPFIRLQCSL